MELIPFADAIGPDLVFDEHGNRIDPDLELLEQFTRVREGVLEVGVVSWDVQIPSLEWIEVLRLAEDADVDAARRDLFLESRYFAVCNECHERRVKGHMHGAICQGCADRHGMIFCGRGFLELQRANS